MSDQERISPHNINTISSGQLIKVMGVIKGKYKLWDYELIQI